MTEEETIAEKLLNDARRDLNTSVQSQATIAIILKAKYDALLEVGFSPIDALDIIKARGIMP